jgi:pyruvate formate lyase activating enzyme
MSTIETDLELPGEGSAVRVLGWSKTTLLDFPGRVASTLFLQGCNFRCPYCHNPELVTFDAGGGQAPLLDLEEILAYLSTYSRMLEGVCLTGGEPLLQKGLAELCRQIKRLGLRVKLDTNGTLPDRLEALLDGFLLDYVAVDIKGPPGKIRAIARTEVPEAELAAATKTTVELLQASAVPYELRTTVVPGLLDEGDLLALGEWLAGDHRYVLQQFRPGKCLDPLFTALRPYPPEFLHGQAEALSGYFSHCSVRGVDRPRVTGKG